MPPRPRYEAELARERFLSVDPRNRLVAANLELEWNQRLHEVADAETELDDRQGESVAEPNERDRVLALVKDFPRLWNDPRTAVREKKRLLRLLIEDVTLDRGERIEVHVRFRGGTSQSLELESPKNAFELRRTPAETVHTIHELLEEHTETQVAEILNQQGQVSGTGMPIDATMIGLIRRAYGLPNRSDRLRRRGFVTLTEAARSLRVGSLKVLQWAEQGKIKRHHVAGRRYYYDINSQPNEDAEPNNSTRGAV